MVSHLPRFNTGKVRRLYFICQLCLMGETRHRKAVSEELEGVPLGGGWGECGELLRVVLSDKGGRPPRTETKIFAFGCNRKRAKGEFR